MYELVALGQAPSDERKRRVRDQLLEPELTILDIPTRPGPSLSQVGREEVKKVARNASVRARSVVSLDWHRRAKSRAQMRLVIQGTLDDGLSGAYTRSAFARKAAALFDHIFEKYGSSGAAA